MLEQKTIKIPPQKTHYQIKFFFLFYWGVNLLWKTGEKEAQQELHFNEGPGTDMNLPVQNSVCCSVKRDPLSGWRPHDAQVDDISMKLCGRRSRGSPVAQSPHSSHLQGRADDVNLLTWSRWPALSDTHLNFILIEKQQNIQTHMWLHT